eukprot:GHVN01087597.1.p1 GENE.GHVN01087597.1~~GHVN01087597.1.p1  ORF type:complete len:113 (+),score=20.91 GHVN01087597.1:98-436(+)
MGECQTKCKDTCGGAEELKVEDDGDGILADREVEVEEPKAPPPPPPELYSDANIEAPLEDRPEVQLDGGMSYTGQWRGDVREGKGVLKRPDGTYTGDFRNNKAHVSPDAALR